MKKTAYWITTIFVSFVMTTSGMLALTHAPAMMKALAHLGYPAYFSNLLGVAKLSGVCVLLVPGWVRLKEWAYVGFGITILSACYSHLLSGDGFLALEPLITFVALLTSYLTRPSDREFFLSTNTSLDRALDGAGMARGASREVYSHGRNTR
jgi:hypothetical protein